MDSVFIACRFVHFSAAMLVFGAAAFRLYAMERGDPRAAALLDAPLRPVLLAAAALALLSALAMVPCVAGQMAGSASAAFDRHTLALVLGETSFGHIWLWHLLLAVLLLGACAALRTRGGLLAVLAALLLASLAWVGHAAAQRGPFLIGPEVNDAIHLLAGAVWLGGLVPLAIVASRAVLSRDKVWLAALRRVLPRFSRAAYLAVALVAATGVGNAVLLVGSIAGLTGTDYGRLLLVKLSLVLLLLAVAVINRLVLTPWILSDTRPWGATAALSGTIAIEQLLGLAIIAVVSVLGTLPPAAHMHMH